MPEERPSPKTWAVQLRARAAVETLVKECAKDGIEVLPVKGVITSRILYADMAERPMRDADVRVRPEDLERALIAAKRGGAELVYRLRAYRSLIVMFDDMQVDIETTVGPPGLCDLSVDAMLRRAERSTLLGFDHLAPEIHDHALLLCVNVFKDKLTLAEPSPLEDVRLIAAKIDPRIFADRAREARATTLAWIVADYMDTDGWRRVQDALGEPKRPRYVRAFRGAGPEPLRTLLGRVANDRPSARIQAVIQMLRWGLERGRLL